MASILFIARQTLGDRPRDLALIAAAPVLAILIMAATSRIPEPEGSAELQERIIYRTGRKMGYDEKALKAIKAMKARGPIVPHRSPQQGD